MSVPAGHRIEYVPVAELVGAVRNPKKHAQADIQASMGRFGYVEPIVLDERTGRLVAGHGRTEALMQLQKSGAAPPAGIQVDPDGKWRVPVMRGWASKNDREAEAYLVASNRLTELGAWDDSALAVILEDLKANDALLGTGFDDDFITKLLDEQALPGGQTDPDDVPSPDEVPSRTRVGDIWTLGNHRIVCGDSTHEETYQALMGDALADFSFTDPPWNIAYDGEASRGRPSKGREIVNDNLGAAFPGFCSAFSGSMADHLKPGAPIYLAMSAQEWGTIHTALVGAGFHWSSTIIWAKDVFNVGRKDYHAQYEPLWYGWKEGAARLMAVEDRTQSDVWAIPRPKKSDEHPTMKPVELIVRALKNSSRRGALVLEPFSGSGSTIIACEQTDRSCRAIELDPKYVDVAVKRWEDFTGKLAELQR
jgi:DNA modification methylase